ncbi:MAG TPA: hypothetical protein VF989_12085, partial [Polyangiaceae bacterium]
MRYQRTLGLVTGGLASGLASGLAWAVSAAAQPPEETTGEAPPSDQFYLDPAPPPATGSDPAQRAPAAQAPPPAAESAPRAPRGEQEPVYEPPPPGVPPGYGPSIIYEPPPPPEPRHTAPKTALWAGVRLGWFFPHGNLWAEVDPTDPRFFIGRGWREFASSGPSFELNVGARLGRNYNLFALWERGELGDGESFEADLHGGQTGGDTDFWAVALRANSDPDRVGLAVEVALGYRRFRATWDDGTELRLTDAPFEAR